MRCCVKAQAKPLVYTLSYMKNTLIILCCLFSVQSIWSQDLEPISRDSLKTVLIQLKALSKTENIEEALALKEFYEVHNAKLENPLHGEIVIKDAMKRIEKTRTKQERRTQFNYGNTWSADPIEEKVEVEPIEGGEPGQANDVTEPLTQIKEVQVTDSDVWRAKPEQTSQGSSRVNTNAVLTNRTDSRILHSKLIHVKGLLKKSRTASRVAWASLIIPPAAIVIFPVMIIVSSSKRNQAYRLLDSLQ